MLLRYNARCWDTMLYDTKRGLWVFRPRIL